MIPLSPPALDNETLSELQAYQSMVDAKPTFDLKKEEAKILFKRYNTQNNPTFTQVKLNLTKMCAGARRCVYCEDSVADEVEHIFPKGFYPGKTFRWDNYVYICGTCNKKKSDKFAIYSLNDDIQKLVRGHEPANDNAVLLNPRNENPLDFATLDISETFHFIPNDNLSAREKKRMDYTYNTTFDFDKRDELVEARKEAYNDYKARIVEYLQHKNRQTPPERLQNLIVQFKKKNHPSVWEEIKRFHQKNWLINVDPEFSEYLNMAPESLSW